MSRFQAIADAPVNLTTLGFGDELYFEIDKENCVLRISVFEEGHYCDEMMVDLSQIKNRRE